MLDLILNILLKNLSLGIRTDFILIKKKMCIAKQLFNNV